MTRKFAPDIYRRRPKEFNPRQAEIIIERVMNGETLDEICAEEDYPLPGVFMQWIRRDPHLAAEYGEALEIRTELMVDSMVSVADDVNTSRARNQLEARKFHAERLMPKKYGPRAFNVEEKKDDVSGGIDYGAEVRRKLANMAQSLKSAPAT